MCWICWTAAGLRQMLGDPRPQVEIYNELLDSGEAHPAPSGCGAKDQPRTEEE